MVVRVNERHESVNHFVHTAHEPVAENIIKSNAGGLPPAGLPLLVGDICCATHQPTAENHDKRQQSPCSQDQKKKTSEKIAYSVLVKHYCFKMVSFLLCVIALSSCLQASTTVILTNNKEYMVPLPGKPTKCFRCNGRSSRHVVKATNMKGNAGKPYYRCADRPKRECGFLVFSDSQGNSVDNPPCDCNASSKLQVAGPDKGRQAHYVCRLGECDFWQAGSSDNQQVADLQVENSLLHSFGRLGLVQSLVR